jgi:hypothetical protein
VIGQARVRIRAVVVSFSFTKVLLIGFSVIFEDLQSRQATVNNLSGLTRKAAGNLPFIYKETPPKYRPSIPKILAE